MSAYVHACKHTLRPFARHPIQWRTCRVVICIIFFRFISWFSSHFVFSSSSSPSSLLCNLKKTVFRMIMNRDGDCEAIFKLKMFQINALDSVTKSSQVKPDPASTSIWKYMMIVFALAIGAAENDATFSSCFFFSFCFSMNYIENGEYEAKWENCLNFHYPIVITYFYPFLFGFDWAEHRPKPPIQLFYFQLVSNKM